MEASCPSSQLSFWGSELPSTDPRTAPQQLPHSTPFWTRPVLGGNHDECRSAELSCFGEEAGQARPGLVLVGSRLDLQLLRIRPRSAVDALGWAVLMSPSSAPGMQPGLSQGRSRRPNLAERPLFSDLLAQVTCELTLQGGWGSSLESPSRVFPFCQA